MALPYLAANDLRYCTVPKYTYCLLKPGDIHCCIGLDAWTNNLCTQKAGCPELLLRKYIVRSTIALPWHPLLSIFHGHLGKCIRQFMSWIVRGLPQQSCTAKTAVVAQSVVACRSRVPKTCFAAMGNRESDHNTSPARMHACTQGRHSDLHCQNSRLNK